MIAISGGKGKHKKTNHQAIRPVLCSPVRWLSYFVGS